MYLTNNQFQNYKITISSHNANNIKNY